MLKFNESERPYRNGDSGPKYLVQGPHWDGGLALFKPGQSLGAHRHLRVSETFICLDGFGTILVNGTAHPFRTGDVVILEPGETHDICNTGATDLRFLFIKSPYHPDDRVAA